MVEDLGDFYEILDDFSSELILAHFPSELLNLY